MNLHLILHWVLSFLIPVVIVELIRREINQKGPKLVYYSSQVISHRIMPRAAANSEQPASAPAQPFWLNSLILTITNNGNVVARNVEISHPQAPENFQLTPALEHSIVRSDDSGKMIIKIPSVGPKETVAISYLFGRVSNWNDLLEFIRSEDGVAQRIKMNFNRVFPMWFNWMVLAFCFLGLIFLGVIIWWFYPPVIYIAKWLFNFHRA